VTGPKTNEGATKVGERTGTRAELRYARVSATKVRRVLDLIRGKGVQDADDILHFVERDAALLIRKVLASAVANAEHNDSQAADELYVAACYADEGPTLKRFRPRARGRAARIRKRGCHITIIVSRMSDTMLERRRQQEAAKPSTARARRSATSQAAARRERVARSRQAAAARQGTEPAPGPTEHDEHEHEHDEHEHEHDEHERDEHEHEHEHEHVETEVGAADVVEAGAAGEAATAEAAAEGEDEA